MLRYQNLLRNDFIKNKMIKRLIEYLIIERELNLYIIKSSLKSNNVRNYISYSTLNAIR